MKVRVLVVCLLVGFMQAAWGWATVGDSLRLGLPELVQQALRHNEQLKIAEARVRGAEAAVQESRGASLPQLDATFSYTYLDIVPGFKKVVLGNIEHDMYPNVTIRQPLYTGGRLKHLRSAAQASVESQNLSLRNDEQSLKLAVGLDYYQLLSLRNQIGIVQENRRQLAVQQQYARLLIQAGRMSELELGRLEVELAALDGRLLKLHNDYQQTCNELVVLCGLPDWYTIVPSDTLTMEPVPVDSAQLLAYALENNPAWRRLASEERRAEAQLRAQMAARYPQISAVASYGYEFGIESFSFAKNKRYLVGLSAQMPVFDWGVSEGKIGQANSQLEQVQWQRQLYQRSLAAQVKNLYLRLKEMAEQVAIQKQAVEQARQAHRLAMIEYHAGRRSNTDLLDIQKTLLNSQLTLNEAVVNYNRSRAQLLYMLGAL